jgi:hypothetical protein
MLWTVGTDVFAAAAVALSIALAVVQYLYRRPAPGSHGESEASFGHTHRRAFGASKSVDARMTSVASVSAIRSSPSTR